MGARNNLQRWLHLANPLDDAAARRTLDRRRPYCGLIYFHLLLDRLAEAGFLEPGSPPPQTSGSNHLLFPPDMPETEREEAIRSTFVKGEERPENVAGAVVFFVENDFVTGVCLPVDGGRTV